MNPTLINSAYVFEKKNVKIRKDTVQYSKGVPVEHFIVEAPAYSVVLAFTPTKEIILVRQYRAALRETTLELPAGKLEENETPEQAALREFREETGYELKKLHYLGEALEQPGRSTIRAHLFLGETGLKKDSKLEEAEEGLSIEAVSLFEAYSLIQKGTINSLHSLAAFAKAQILFPKHFRGG
jgi:ADP-ribose pyrophosphatase